MFLKCSTADKTTLRDMLKLIQQRYGNAERITAAKTS